MLGIDEIKPMREEMQKRVWALEWLGIGGRGDSSLRLPVQTNGWQGLVTTTPIKPSMHKVTPYNWCKQWIGSHAKTRAICRCSCTFGQIATKIVIAKLGDLTFAFLRPSQSAQTLSKSEYQVFCPFCFAAVGVLTL
jgi:hypothetical protein